MLRQPIYHGFLASEPYVCLRCCARASASGSSNRALKTPRRRHATTSASTAANNNSSEASVDAGTQSASEAKSRKEEELRRFEKLLLLDLKPKDPTSVSPPTAKSHTRKAEPPVKSKTPEEEPPVKSKTSKEEPSEKPDTRKVKSPAKRGRVRKSTARRARPIKSRIVRRVLARIKPQIRYQLEKDEAPSKELSSEFPATALEGRSFKDAVLASISVAKPKERAPVARGATRGNKALRVENAEVPISKPKKPSRYTSATTTKPEDVNTLDKDLFPDDNTGEIAAKAAKLAKIEKITPDSLKFEVVDIEKLPVPGLAYGLHRALFNPGVYHIQDPMSGVYNFDPYLQKPMAVADFDFNAITPYITSSKDKTLVNTAIRLGKKYAGSTSSMTSTLSHFHFLLSQWREINTKMLSQAFPAQFNSFTKLSRAPSAIFLKWKDGAYGIDADKQYDNPNILSMLGKSLEKLLTLDKEAFERYRKVNSGQITEAERNQPESYNYSTSGDFLMRSQLDAYDERLPGTGMFDLKTRACLGIRMNIEDYETGMGYEIKTQRGEWESFEREYYDMIRAAMLKYSLQVRMGRMDGIFVAFHNITRIFGFQYISLKEMDYALHGEASTLLGDQEFKLSLKLLNEVLDRASRKYPEQSLRIHFESREASIPFMYIFVEPVTDEEIENIQNTNAEEIEKFEKQILGLHGSTNEFEIYGDNQQSEVNNAVAQETTLNTADAPNTLATSKQEGNSDGIGQSENKDNWNDDSVTYKYKDEGDALAKEASEHPIEADEATKADGLALGANDSETENASVDFKTQGTLHESTGGTSLEAIDSAVIETKSTDDETANAAPNAVPETEPESPPGTFADEKPDAFVSLANAYNSTQSSGDSNFLDKLGKPPSSAPKDLLGMVLTIRNSVNGVQVQRPQNLLPSDEWTIEYSISEIEKESRVASLYQACTARRAKAFADDPEKANVVNDKFMRLVKEYSEQGAVWRKAEDERQKDTPVRMWDGTVIDPAEQTQAAGGVDTYLDWLYADQSTAAEQEPSAGAE